MAKVYIHFIPNLSSGGAETFLLRLIEELPGNHTIVTFWRDRICYKDLLPINSNHISINPVHFRFWQIISLYVMLQRLSSLDRVFSWLYMSDFISSLFWLLSFSKFKLIWNIRNTIVKRKQYSLFSVFCFHISRTIFKKIPHLVVFNSSTSLEQHFQLGYPKCKSLVIYNGYKDYTTISHNSIQLPTDNFNITCVARLHPQKNHHFLFETLSYCLDIPFRLHLVGLNLCFSNSPLVSTLDKFIKGRYHLYGLRPQPFVHDLFSHSDLSILTSKYGEAFPNVVAESMLQGCYPICFDVGDARRIVGDYGSCLPLETSAYDLSLIIRSLYEEKNLNPQLWSSERSKRSDYASSTFSLSSSAQAFLSL